MAGARMFDFSLEPLLKQRKFIEESLQKEFAAIQDQFNTQQRKLDKLSDSRESCGKRLRQLGGKGVLISELKLHFEYLKRLSIEQYEVEQTLSRIHANLEKKRGAVVEAMKGRKILENLKERGLRVYRDSIRKKEMKSADEIAINLFNRKGF